MFTLSQYLNEARAHGLIGSQGEYFRVTNSAVLKGLLKQYHELRGMIFDSHIDVWNSYDAIHYDYKRYVNPSNAGLPVYFRKGDAPGGVIIYVDRSMSWIEEEMMENHHILQKIIPGYDFHENVRTY